MLESFIINLIANMATSAGAFSLLAKKLASATSTEPQQLFALSCRTVRIRLYRKACIVFAYLTDKLYLCIVA